MAIIFSSFSFGDLELQSPFLNRVRASRPRLRERRTLAGLDLRNAGAARRPSAAAPAGGFRRRLRVLPPLDPALAGRNGSEVDYSPSQEVGHLFPEISPEAFRRAFQLVLPDGRTFEGAEAVLATLAEKPGGSPLLALYRRLPGAAPLVDLAYRLIARHRRAAMAVTRLAWGESVLPPTYFAANALFLRLLGLCALAAFRVAVGPGGRADRREGRPARVGVLAGFAEHAGSERYWLVPTLSWIAPSDAALHVLCGRTGVAASLALVAGLAPAWSAAAVWLLYLSLSVAGQVFLEFQWDFLLLEAGLLAVFLRRPRAPARPDGPGGAPAGAISSSSGCSFASCSPRARSSSEAATLPGGASRPCASTTRRSLCLPWTAWFVHQLPAALPHLVGVFCSSSSSRCRFSFSLRGGCAGSPAP